MSGHSKWDTIKHKKAINDAKKGKSFSKISALISHAAKQGGGDPNMNPNKIIIIGDKYHPEIEGINLWAGGDCIIGKDCSDFLFLKGSKESFIVVTQTTFSVEKYQEIKKCLKDNLKDIVFYDTICDATKVRQEDAMKISQEVDAMVVIGGKHSSNTKKLYNLCENICKTFLIETVNDIDEDTIKPYDIIGVTAGASTPDFTH